MEIFIRVPFREFSFPITLDVYTSIWSQTKSRCHRCFRQSRYGLLHMFPACISKFLPQSLFRHLPVRLSLSYLPLACPRQAKQTLPPVFSALDLNPTLLTQRAQRPCQRRAVHRKARTQPFLISLSSCSQCGEQAELRDLESCLS